MRRLIHLTLSPSCRLARLMVGEKRIACDPVIAEDFKNAMPIFVDMDGTQAEGVWAILDHLEQHYPDYPLAPADDAEVVDTLAQYLNMNPERRQQLLEMDGPLRRARALIDMLSAQ